MAIPDIDGLSLQVEREPARIFHALAQQTPIPPNQAFHGVTSLSTVEGVRPCRDRPITNLCPKGRRDLGLTVLKRLVVINSARKVRPG